MTGPDAFALRTESGERPRSTDTSTDPRSALAPAGASTGDDEGEGAA